METYALFADRSTSRTVSASYKPLPDDPPFKIVFPTIKDDQAAISIINGGAAAYQALMHQGLLTGREQFFFSCQFADEAADRKVHGGSAGLAFCLHLAQEMCPNRFQGTAAIAATGTVSDGTQDARVGKVEGIVLKLEAALDVLSPGGKILIPKENDREIPLELRRKVEHQEIDLLAVDTVQQALEALLLPWPDGSDGSDEPPPSPRKRRWIAYMLTGVLLVAVLAGAYFLRPGLDVESTVAQIATHLEQGEFLSAREQLATLRQATGDKYPAVAILSSQIDSMFHLEAHFHYVVPGQKGKVPIRPEPGQSSPALSLSSGDRYRLECTVNDRGYLYIYQVDASGKVDQLPDPNPYADPLFLQAGRPYFFPPGDREWFTLDAQEGQETLYFVAARQLGRDLQEVYRQYREATGPEKERFRDQLVTQLQERQRARAAGIKGVFYSAFTFQHESPGETKEDRVSIH